MNPVIGLAPQTKVIVEEEALSVRELYQEFETLISDV
jgi:hypothetical protein